MQALGIDIGSRTIKTVLIADGTVLRREVADATSRPSAVIRELLAAYKAETRIVATGYGRHLADPDGIRTVTEIRACARGIAALGHAPCSVIDIGGQDVKTIILGEKGTIVKFEMNDRCAAGTGRFLEIMADKLEYPPDAFGEAALSGKEHLTISSLCTVFAESEVIGLLNRDCRREDIARALHKSAIKKISGMHKRIAKDSLPVILAGGGALNSAIAQLLEYELNCPVTVAEHPQTVTATGAALIAASTSSSYTGSPLQVH
jgi:(R)-2-hydroxyacyl-CoA dehydratese activating ATPase